MRFVVLTRKQCWRGDYAFTFGDVDGMTERVQFEIRVDEGRDDSDLESEWCYLTNMEISYFGETEPRCYEIDVVLHKKSYHISVFVSLRLQMRSISLHFLYHSTSLNHVKIDSRRRSLHIYSSIHWVPCSWSDGLSRSVKVFIISVTDAIDKEFQKNIKYLNSDFLQWMLLHSLQPDFMQRTIGSETFLDFYLYPD